MRVPFNWLKEYVDISITPEELARKLTMAGIAVENVEFVTDTEVVFELELTPNRSDCLGMLNLAREVAAITGGELSLPPVVQEDQGPADLDAPAVVEILDPELCGRYIAKCIQNVQIAPSPAWLQERLQAAGIRSINNIVDVTNYVMWETGQPLHAFDYDTLNQGRIIVRSAQPCEKIHTLDEVERTLDSDMLVIADPQGAVAIAGVMGGLATEVTAKTQRILLESANFNRASVRRTSRKLGLRSESSARFEKGVDISGAAFAANRAAQLIAELGQGQVVPGVVDCFPKPTALKQITLRVSRTNQLLGTQLELEEIRKILNRLQFHLDVLDPNTLQVQAPSYRGDLEFEEDLIEEVARLHGYEQIPVTLPYGATTQGVETPEQKQENQARRLLTACGLNEILTFSMVSPKVFDRIALDPGDPLRQAIALANPLNEEQSILRTTLVPNLLEVAAWNCSRRSTDMAIFELGRVFLPSPEGQQLPRENRCFAALSMGIQKNSWNAAAEEMDFYFLKGVMETLLKGLGLRNYRFAADPTLGPTYHPGRSAAVWSGEHHLGFLAELHPDVLESYALPKRVWVGQLDLDGLIALALPGKDYRPLSRYPSVQRDLALVAAQSVSAETVEGKIWAAGQPLLEQLRLFDVYQGSNIAAGYRSLAYSLVYQSQERTLTDQEVNVLHEHVRETLVQDLGVQLR